MTKLQDLETLAEDSAQSFAIRRIAEALATAIHDWPTYNLVSLNDYIRELRDEVGWPVTLANVRAKLDGYSLEQDAWKAESLCGLLGAWDIGDDDLTLDDLVKRIDVHFVA